MNLTPEQLAYLKELESPKKRRKFMLDCLVENALGESEFLKQVEDAINSPFNRAMHQTSTAPETLKNTKDVFPEYEKYLLDQENHLCWVYNRLIVVYGESPLFDYMHKLREIAVNYKPELPSNEEGKLVGLLKTCGYSEADNKEVDLPENLYEIKNGEMVLDDIKNYDIRQFGHLFVKVNGEFQSAYVMNTGRGLNINTADKIKDGMYEVFTVKNSKIVPFVKNDQSAKSNHSPEEIEIAKSLNSEREENKQIVKDEKFRRTVDAIKHLRNYLPHFCFESKPVSLKVTDSAFNYFENTYFVVKLFVREEKQKMIQVNCENVPKEAFDEIEKKWTDKDMEKCFVEALCQGVEDYNKRLKPAEKFRNYLKSLKND
jgi:hypothetical protein